MKSCLYKTIFFCVCLVFKLSASMSQFNFCYIQPKPNSDFINPETQLTLKVDDLQNFRLIPSYFHFKVMGRKSGIHTGNVIISGNTIIFKTEHSFESDEIISVGIEPSEDSLFEPISYQFKTGKYFLKDAEEESPTFDLKKSALSLSPAPEINEINGVAVPNDFPVFQPSILKENIAPGKIFIDNKVGTQYIMILENDGTPYFYQHTNELSHDFKLQPNGMLTIKFGSVSTSFLGMDASYAFVDTFCCVNGYETDGHDFTMLEDGHYFLIAKGYRVLDMSRLISGGKIAATVSENHVQEFDENGNLVFQWLSHDYFDITDAVHEDLTQNIIDYVHMNSVAVDYDGNIIISSRHLSEVTKINRQTGKIIWRLGGENNQFEFVNDSYQNSYQHDVRPVPGEPNHYTMFDNGNYHEPAFSRAVEFVLDTDEMKATKVWEYRHSPDYYSSSMGSVQRLSNGNTLIDWADGSLPKVTEVTSDGEVVYEADFVDASPCYRTFRFEWESVLDVPRLIAESYSDKIRLIFNKFGDKDVAQYIIYSGKSSTKLTPLDSTANTWLDLSNLQNNTSYYFKVCAKSTAGLYSSFSDVVRITTNFTTPGDNMLHNGDFSLNDNGWNVVLNNDTDANGRVEDGVYNLEINSGGSEYEDVQITQENLLIVHGQKYSYEFDARAVASRIIEVQVTQNGGNNKYYSNSSPVVVRRQMSHYYFEFEMERSTDGYAQLAINCGGSDFDVYLDNITLKEINSSAIEETDNVLPKEFQLFQNYPNPFNPVTKIQFSLSELSQVKIKIFNALGELVENLLDEPLENGLHEIEFNAEKLSSGVYFCQLSGITESCNTHFGAIRKMVVLK